MVLVFLLGIPLAQASVVLSGTRLIFEGGTKEATMRISNDGDLPTLIQAWLDKGEEEESPDQINVPFVMTPTMFRMEPRKGQTLRIIYSGEPLPVDRESLFWLNVLSIPPKDAAESGANQLQFAFRTRIKMMYRPAGLPGKAQEAPEQLRWQLAVDAGAPVLRASNPTAYVVHLAGIALQSGETTFDAGVGHVLPGQTASFPVRNAPASAVSGATVAYSSINDWGGVQTHEAAIGKDIVASPR